MSDKCKTKQNYCLDLKVISVTQRVIFQGQKSAVNFSANRKFVRVHIDIYMSYHIHITCSLPDFHISRYRGWWWSSR